MNEHIKTLIAHGAQIGCGVDLDGQPIKTPLDESVYTEHLRFIRNQPCITALTFNLYLPGIDEPLGLVIWEDGHVDSGSTDTLAKCLDR